MKAISLVVFAFALAQVFVNGAEEAAYSMPWWASMYAPEQVKALVDTEALVAQAKATAPAGSDTTDAMYMGYQGAGLGSVMLETGSELHADAMEDILLEQHLESLVNMDSFLDASADAKYVPALEIFPDHAKPAHFQKGWKFHTMPNSNSSLVDKILANDEEIYKFSKMHNDGKAIKAAEDELIAHAERMKDIKTEINDFEDHYWNNGGLYIPEKIAGGSSFMQTEGSEQEQEHHHLSLDQQLLEELEDEIDNEHIEEKMEQDGIAQANAEDAQEAQSFMETEAEHEVDEEAEDEAEEGDEAEEEEEEEEPQQNAEEPEQSFAESEVEYIATPNPDMVPIPPRVQDIVDAHYATTEEMYHPIPVNMVKSIGDKFVANGGTFEARVGPEAGAVADWILQRAADVPTLEKRQYPLWLAHNTTKYAGELLHGYREIVHAPFEDPKSHGIVEADMKPRIIYDMVNGTMVANFEKRP